MRWRRRVRGHKAFVASLNTRSPLKSPYAAFVARNSRTNCGAGPGQLPFTYSGAGVLVSIVADR